MNLTSQTSDFEALFAQRLDAAMSTGLSLLKNDMIKAVSELSSKYEAITAQHEQRLVNLETGLAEAKEAIATLRSTQDSKSTPRTISQVPAPLKRAQEARSQVNMSNEQAQVENSIEAWLPEEYREAYSRKMAVQAFVSDIGGAWDQAGYAIQGTYPLVTQNEIVSIKPVLSANAADAWVTTTAPYTHPISKELVTNQVRYKFIITLTAARYVDACMQVARFLPGNIFLNRACTPVMNGAKKSYFQYTKALKQRHGIPASWRDHPVHPSVKLEGQWVQLQSDAEARTLLLHYDSINNQRPDAGTTSSNPTSYRPPQPWNTRQSTPVNNVPPAQSQAMDHMPPGHSSKQISRISAAIIPRSREESSLAFSDATPLKTPRVGENIGMSVDEIEPAVTMNAPTHTSIVDA